MNIEAETSSSFKDIMTPSQQQYISEWHDDFVNFIGGLLSQMIISKPQ